MAELEVLLCHLTPEPVSWNCVQPSSLLPDTSSSPLLLCTLLWENFSPAGWQAKRQSTLEGGDQPALAWAEASPPLFCKSCWFISPLSGAAFALQGQPCGEAEACNWYYLVLYRKHLLTPVLIHQESGRMCFLLQRPLFFPWRQWFFKSQATV